MTPTSVLTARTARILGYVRPRNPAWTAEKRNMGKNSSFMCSQVDSLTAEKAAARGLPPLHS